MLAYYLIEPSFMSNEALDCGLRFYSKVSKN